MQMGYAQDAYLCLHVVTAQPLLGSQIENNKKPKLLVL